MILTSRKASRLLAALGALIVCGIASAENPAPADTLTAADITAPPAAAAPAVWTFNDCLNWALENNTDMRRTMLNILTARQDVLSAKDAWLPTVDFSTNQNFTNYPAPEAGTKSNSYGSSYNIGAAWTVWDGNARKYRSESAKLIEQQQAIAGDDVVKTLKLGVLEAYLNIMYAGEAVKIAEQTLQVSTSQAARARKLADSGRTSMVEAAQIESQQAQDAYNLTMAQSNYESAKMALKQILTLGIDYNLNVADVEFPDSDVLSPLPDRLEVYTLASEWLPQLRSNELSKSIYSNDVKIAKSSALPSISLQGGLATGYNSGSSAGWASSMGRNFNENIGLTLRVPIFDGNSTKRAVAKARLAELEYDLNKKELLDNLSQTIEGLYINATNARSKYSAGLVQLDAIEKTDALVNRQFELGYVQPLDLLSAHNNLLNARLELLQSKYMSILAAKTIQYYATQQLDVK
ncbi:MAG: TolC family protein [Muribaculaceae bacterium]|nr:TolC family protein [Muribaculaceae bacterium]